MTDLDKIAMLIKQASAKCRFTNCDECEHFAWGIQCKVYNCADYLIQNGVGVIMKDGDNNETRI